MTNRAIAAGSHPGDVPDVLRLAFDKFSEAGARLESRHQALLAEVDRLRAALEERTREAKRLERLAMLGETAAALAHEVRNPLGSLKLFLSMLREDIGENAAVSPLMSGMSQSIEALDNVVSNILTFARRPQTGSTRKRAPISVHAVIHEKLSCILPRDSRIAIEVHLDGSPFVRADEHALRQVFHNLFLNAVQAMRGSGVLQVSSYDQGSDVLCVKVSDCGPGIPAEMRERLFEPFATTRPDGTGLGLAIARQVIEDHGGEIHVENVAAPLHGACFTIRLPRSGEPQARRVEFRTEE